MDSQTLLNGFKALFSTLGAKTSNSNYAVPLVGANDGEPKGFMNMSNLASVLGVNRFAYVTNISGEAGLSINYGGNGVQVYFTDDGKIVFRKSKNGGTYGEWLTNNP